MRDFPLTGFTGAFLLGAREGTEEGCVGGHCCCWIFRQRGLRGRSFSEPEKEPKRAAFVTTAVAGFPANGVYACHRSRAARRSRAGGALCAPLNTEKIRKNQTSLIFADFFCVLLPGNSLGDHEPNWRKQVCSPTQARSPAASLLLSSRKKVTYPFPAYPPRYCLCSGASAQYSSTPSAMAWARRWR